MTGTIINIAAILIGGAIGLFFGARIPDRLKSTVISAMGLFTALIGIQMFFKTENALIVLGSMLIGALLGEWWQIEDGLEAFGRWLEGRFYKGNADSSSTPGNSRSRFIIGFMTASLLYCIGPMAILGSIQDGLTGDYQNSGDKICFGPVRLDRFCLHSGSGGIVLCGAAGHLPGRNQPVGRAAQCHRHAVDDE